MSVLLLASFFVMIALGVKYEGFLYTSEKYIFPILGHL